MVQGTAKMKLGRLSVSVLGTLDGRRGTRCLVHTWYGEYGTISPMAILGWMEPFG